MPGNFGGNFGYDWNKKSMSSSGASSSSGMSGKEIALLGSLMEAGSTYGSVQANKGGSKFNRAVLNRQAKQEVYSGRVEAQRIREQGAKIGGAQRVGAAAGNVIVNQGTALKLQEETAMLSGADAEMAYQNALLRAWGYKAQAQQEKYAQQVQTNKAYSDLAAGFLDTGFNVGLFG